jgi:hypothetical protein
VIVKTIASFGFNCIRMPWALQMYEQNVVVGDYAITGMLFSLMPLLVCCSHLFHYWYVILNYAVTGMLLAIMHAISGMLIPCSSCLSEND